MRYYLVAAGLARLADEMAGVAMVLLVLTRTGRPALAGALVTAYTLPTIVSGPLLGAFLDRTRHHRAALAANLAALAGTALGIVLTLGRTPFAVPLLLAAFAGVTLPMTSAGYSSLLPRMLAGSALSRGYLLDASTFNVAAIAGPALAGAISGLAGPGAAVTALAVIALAGLVATTAVPVPSRHRGADAPVTGGTDRPDAAAGRRNGSTVAAVRAGLVHLVRTPVLRGVTVTTVLGSCAVGLLAVALPLYARRVTGHTATVGLFWTAMEAGALVGTFALARWRSPWPPQHIVMAGTLGTGLVMLFWPLTGSTGTAVALVATAGLASGPVLPAVFAVRNGHSPEWLRGQVFTTGASLKIGGYAVGAAVGGALVPEIGPGRAITIAATAHLTAAGLGWWTGARRTAPTRPVPVVALATSGRGAAGPDVVSDS